MSAIEDFDDIKGPIAPSLAVWATLSESERQRVIASLPRPTKRTLFNQGDVRAQIILDLADALEQHYRTDREGGRRCYIGRSVPVEWGETGIFTPALYVVFNVDDHSRERFIVAEEGRGLDIAIEVQCEDDADYYYECKLPLYSHLGINEYFILDPQRYRLRGYRLASDGGSYLPIAAQEGLLYSGVLGLSFGRLGGRFRIFAQDAVLPTTREMTERFRGELDFIRSWPSTGRAVARAPSAAEMAEDMIGRLRKRLADLKAASLPSSRD